MLATNSVDLEEHARHVRVQNNLFLELRESRVSSGTI